MPGGAGPDSPSRGLSLKKAQNVQRKSQRLRQGVEISVQVTACRPRRALEGFAFRCQSDDLAVQGLRMNTPELLPVGTSLELKVKLSGYDRVFDLTADVVWSRESAADGTFQAGVQFTGKKRRQARDWEIAVVDYMRALDG